MPETHTMHLPASTLADRLEDLLPQTQCTKCGYPDCRAYAVAIANGEAAYNQCPPGGAQGVARLAALLGRPVIPLNPANGNERPRPVAVIDESLCIGCTLCIQACPVDAIAGAAKQMHTVLPQPEADAARARHAARGKRLQREREENDARLAAKAAAKLREVEAQSAATPGEQAEQQRKKAIIAAAIERARIKKEEMAARSKA